MAEPPGSLLETFPEKPLLPLPKPPEKPRASTEARLEDLASLLPGTLRKLAESLQAL